MKLDGDSDLRLPPSCVVQTDRRVQFTAVVFRTPILGWVDPVPSATVPSEQILHWSTPDPSGLRYTSIKRQETKQPLIHARI